MNDEPRFEVVSPVGRWAGAQIRRPGRPAGAAPLRIGFVWDHVFRGDEMFRVVEEELQRVNGKRS